MDLEEIQAKYKELSEKRPGTYTLQHRSVRIDQYSAAARNWLGSLAWSPWMAAAMPFS